MKHTIYKCPDCNSCEIEFVGYEDGGGDYGEGFSEIYKCEECGQVIAEHEFDEIWIDEDEPANDQGIDFQV